MTKIIHVGIYARISSEQQRDNTSIDTQLADCRAYAERKGWTVYDTYIDEAKSGRKEQRPEFQRLRKDIQAKRLQAVLVWKVDRLARRARIQHNFIAELEAAGAIFDSVTEQLDLQSSGGRFTAGMLAQVSQLYSDVLSERVSRALQYRAEQGAWVGPVPLGYQRHDGRLVPGDDAPVIQQIFQLYATGAHSYTSIADELNAAGHRALDWQTGTRHLFGRESIRTILKNHAYCGFVSSKGQEYPGRHAALISDELWQRATEIRESRKRKNGNAGLRSPGLLTGMVYCAACGSVMWQHASGTSSRVDYYRCSGFSRRECQVPLQRMDAIDGHATELMASIRLPQRIIDKVIFALHRQVVSTQATTKKRQSRGDLEAALGRYAEVYAEGMITKEVYEARKANIIAQLHELDQAAPPPRLDVKRALDLLGNMPRLFAETSLSARRGLVRSVFDKLWIQDKKIHAITPRQVYLTIFDAIACVSGVADGFQTQAPHIPLYLALPQWLSFQVPRQRM